MWFLLLFGSGMGVSNSWVFQGKTDRKHKQNMEVGFNSTTTGSQRLDRVVMGEIVKIIDLACSEPKIHMKYMKIHIKNSFTDMLQVLLLQFQLSLLIICD